MSAVNAIEVHTLNDSNNKCCYMFVSTMKKKMTHGTTWKSTKNILSERNHTEKPPRS